MKSTVVEIFCQLSLHYFISLSGSFQCFDTVGLLRQ